MPTLFQRSSLTFGEAKSYVAEQHSKHSDPGMLLRAGRAIQRAVQDWNKYNWEWLITAGSDVSVTGGLSTTLYPVPYNYKDMYNLVFEQGGTKRALVSDTKRAYDRVVPMPLTGITTGYNLHRLGDLGKFQIQDPANSDGTISLLYYRRMVVPCTVSLGAISTADGTVGTQVACYPTTGTAGARIGNAVVITDTAPGTGSVLTAEDTVLTALTSTKITLSTAAVGSLVLGDTTTIGGDDQFLDIHADFEWALLARAVEHFLASVGSTDQKLAYWMGQAAKGIEDAKGAQAQKDDRELCFEPLPWNGGYNPNRIVE